MKKLINTFLFKCVWRYIIGIIFIVLSSVLTLVLPRILGLITDGLNSEGIGQDELMKYLLALVGLSVIIFILKFIWRYLLIGNCRNVEIYLRDKLFKHLQTLSVDFFSTHKTGDLMAYAINDIQAIRMVFGMGFIQSLDALIIGSFSVFFMSNMINPRLTLIVFVPLPIIVALIYYIRKHIREKFKKVQEAFAVISDKVQENISGIRVIKAFSQEKHEVENFKVFSQQRVDAQLDLVKVSGLLGPSINVCFGIIMLVFIIYGSQLVISGEISIGDFVAFNSYIGLIMAPVVNVARIIEVWQKGVASYRRLDAIFVVKPEVENNGCIEEASCINGNIEIRNLNFTYPRTTKRVLKNINIKIKQGQTFGILGRSGSGKTTLANLLLRLYNVENGCIFIDNKDINNISSDVLRDSIGYVPQDSFLFSTTIKENIEFFKPIYSDDDIENAAKLSGVYENIVAFPNGFNTVVGERGATLSGGQKQRISIARAIVKKASVLILDDCLSAVDTETENRILKNFKQILQDRTGIIISHRISTLKDADEIIYMENGKIVESGSHDELMELGGRYYNLYLAQSASGIDEKKVLI